MNFINFSQNLSTANFNKFSAISKINTFYEKLIWSDVIILQETVVFKIRFSRIKSEILLKFVLSWVPFVCFNLLLYSTLFYSDLAFITSLLPQICVFKTSYRLFHVAIRKWQNGQHVLKTYVTNVIITFL